MNKLEENFENLEVKKESGQSCKPSLEKNEIPEQTREEIEEELSKALGITINEYKRKIEQSKQARSMFQSIGQSLNDNKVNIYKN